MSSGFFTIGVPLRASLCGHLSPRDHAALARLLVCFFILCVSSRTMRCGFQYLSTAYFKWVRTSQLMPTTLTTPGRLLACIRNCTRSVIRIFSPPSL